MAVLARVHITSQQRMDLPQVLGMESYTAYDFRALIEAFVGSQKPYIVRGFEVTGKTGLFISVSIADCFVFNPLDTNGSFYLGDIDAIDQTIELPSAQPFVYVEAIFKNLTTAPVSAAFWDPLAITNTSEGAEFTATQNSQNIIEMELSVNTVGFTTDAVPICVCKTSSSAVMTLSDARPMMFRLGMGGANPNPGYKYPWSINRTEPVTVGTGISNELTSSFRSRDNTGILNDKGIRSFKEMFDAICTRISEISGSSAWYSNNATQQYVGGLSLSSIFFDSVGHSLQPNKDFVYAWSGTNLSNTGSDPAEWKANYTDIKWQLGATFVSPSSNRAYSDVQFDFAIPDGYNAYLLLEREVTKNAANNVIWKSSTLSTSYFDFVNNYDKVVCGVTSDFAGIAVGDYIRKESQGYSQYYKIEALATSTGLFSATEGAIADSSVVAVKLTKTIDLESTEPFRFFRSKYAESDIVVLPATTNATTCDYYWIARRRGDFIWLRDFGPMWKTRDWQHLDKAWSKIKLLKEYQNLFMTGGGDISFGLDAPNYHQLAWTNQIVIEIAGRAAEYIIPVGTIDVDDGECVYVDIPETDSAPTYTLTPTKSLIQNVPINPLDAGYTDRILVLWHRHGSTITGLGDAPDLDIGETDKIGWDLPTVIRNRLGILTESTYVAYSSTAIIAVGDNYADALSKLDATLYAVITDTAKEEIIVLGSDVTAGTPISADPLSGSGHTYSGGVVFPWEVSNSVVDLQWFVNDIPQTQDQTGLGNECVIKLSDRTFSYSYDLKAGWKLRIRDERTGGSGSGGGGTGEANTASNRGTGAEGLGLFAAKSGVDLQFYRLKQGSGITLTQETNDILIESTGGGGGGEVNTASNRGTVADGEGLYYQKLLYDLQFKRIKAGTNVTLSSDSNSITINSSGGGGGGGEVNTASNIGTGTGLFSSKVLYDLQFKSLKADTASGLSISSDTTSVTYAATLTGANLGTGNGIFLQKNGSGNLEFKSLKQGTNVTITSSSTEITINATGGGGSSLSRYSASATAGEEVWVFADGVGITYARVGTTGTFTIPAGVRLISARIRLPMATIGGTAFTVVYGSGVGSGAGDNIDATDAYRPTVQDWREDTGAQVGISSNISSGFDRIQVTGLTSGQTNVLKMIW